MPKKLIPCEPGERHGRLIAVCFRRVGRKPCEAKWRWLCSCGNFTIVSLAAVRSGNTRSCGCYNLQRIRETKTKHGRYAK